MNPPNTFKQGKRAIEYSNVFMLPLSGRQLPEYKGRRRIQDMFFSKKPPAQASSSISTSPPSPSQGERMINETADTDTVRNTESQASHIKQLSNLTSEPKHRASNAPRKSETSEGSSPRKRHKTGSLVDIPKQGNLKAFFKPKQSVAIEGDTEGCSAPNDQVDHSPDSSKNTPGNNESRETAAMSSGSSSQGTATDITSKPTSSTENNQGPNSITEDQEAAAHSEAKQLWSKVFTKKAPPLCEGHNEPCISLTTKKPGINCGRPFWICARPIGPSGEKEEGTIWRCSTFIWSSDWNG